MMIDKLKLLIKPTIGGVIGLVVGYIVFYILQYYEISYFFSRSFSLEVQEIAGIFISIGIIMGSILSRNRSVIVGSSIGTVVGSIIGFIVCFIISAFIPNGICAGKESRLLLYGYLLFLGTGIYGVQGTSIGVCIAIIPNNLVRGASIIGAVILGSTFPVAGAIIGGVIGYGMWILITKLKTNR